MIQRIQSIYLLLAAVVTGGLPFIFNLWVTTNGTVVFAKDIIYVFAAFLLSAVTSIISLFMFKNRKSQFVINRLNIILNLILLIVFVYCSITTSGEYEISEKGVGMTLPIISIVLLVLANKAIKKDEDLVKSVDRLR
ncbi:MAG: DUF4293 domain-containing protein [Flavobacteriaceae bacterium]